MSTDSFCKTNVTVTQGRPQTVSAQTVFYIMYKLCDRGLRVVYGAFWDDSLIRMTRFGDDIVTDDASVYGSPMVCVFVHAGRFSPRKHSTVSDRAGGRGRELFFFLLVVCFLAFFFLVVYILVESQHRSRSVIADSDNLALGSLDLLY